MADASLIGYRFPSFRFVVEEGKLHEFARAIFATDTCHFDAQVALAQGFAAPPVPPTFSTVTLHWQPPATDNPLSLDLSRVLAGGNEWEYVRPLLAGETLTVQTHIADVKHKQGSRGPMTLIIREMNFYDEQQQLALTARSTIIELPAPPAASAEEPSA